MADEKNGGGDFGGPWLLLFVIVVLVVLFQAAQSGVGGGGSFFGNGIRTGTPSHTGTVEEKLSGQPTPSIRATPPPAPTSNVFLSLGNTAASDPQQEYISFYYSSNAKTNLAITGWAVENARGERNIILAPSPLSIEPGTRVSVISGVGSALFSPFQKEWKVYLGRPFEMWHPLHDTVTLRNSTGKIIGQLSY